MKHTTMYWVGKHEAHHNVLGWKAWSTPQCTGLESMKHTTMSCAGKHEAHQNVLDWKAWSTPECTGLESMKHTMICRGQLLSAKAACHLGSPSPTVVPIGKLKVCVSVCVSVDSETERENVRNGMWVSVCRCTHAGVCMCVHVCVLVLLLGCNYAHQYVFVQVTRMNARKPLQADICILRVCMIRCMPHARDSHSQPEWGLPGGILLATGKHVSTSLSKGPFNVWEDEVNSTLWILQWKLDRHPERSQFCIGSSKNIITTSPCTHCEIIQE